MRTKIDPNNVDLDFLKTEFNRFRSELYGMKDKLGANASDALDQMSAESRLWNPSLRPWQAR